MHREKKFTRRKKLIFGALEDSNFSKHFSKKKFPSIQTVSCSQSWDFLTNKEVKTHWALLEKIIKRLARLTTTFIVPICKRCGVGIQLNAPLSRGRSSYASNLSFWIQVIKIVSSTWACERNPFCFYILAAKVFVGAWRLHGIYDGNTPGVHLWNIP